MNDQDKDELVDELMQHIRSTIVTCVRQAVRDYSQQCIPKECTVSLWASETAAYIGKDSWTSRDKALASVWKRTNEAHFNAVFDVWRAHGGCLPDGDATKADVHKRLAEVFDPFPNVLTSDDVESFRKTASTSDVLKLYKAKGQVFEETLAKEFSKTVFQPVQSRHSSVVWSSVTQRALPRPAKDIRDDNDSITDPGPFQIVGQVDGWLCLPPYENTIVEIKLRCTRIPKQIPFRDFAQVQTYLHVHDTREAMYVQGLLGSRELRVETIVRDEGIWRSEIFPGLRAFVCDVRRLLRGASADVPLQSKVLSALNDDSQKAAPLVSVPAASRSSSYRPAAHKKTSVPKLSLLTRPVSVPKANTKVKKTTPPATTMTPLAFLPPEYKPKPTAQKVSSNARRSTKTGAEEMAGPGYNTRSKKRRKHD